MADKRQRPRMETPRTNGTHTVAVVLKVSDYRLLFELALTKNTSLAETIRQLIRNAAPEAELPAKLEAAQINWRDDPTAIVEDDEPMTRREYE